MLLYLSGSYSGKDHAEIAANITRAREAAIKLWELGHYVICPHLNTAHFEQDCNAVYDQYIEGDLAMLRMCDGIVMLPGFSQSKGAMIELKEAERIGLREYLYPRNLPAAIPFVKYDRPVVIGLAGPAGSGKTTAAAVLVEEFGYVRVRFADPLKKMLQAMGLGWAYTDGPLKELDCRVLGDHSPRRAMQTLGTEWGRQTISAPLWIDLAKAEINRLLLAGRSVVVDDVRFENEVVALRSYPGEVFVIERPGNVGAVSGISGHASEAYHYEDVLKIVNDSTVFALEQSVRAVHMRLMDHR